MTQFSVLPPSNESEKSSKNQVDELDELSRKEFTNSFNQKTKELNDNSDNKFHNQVNQLLNKAISSITKQDSEDPSFTEDFSNSTQSQDLSSPKLRDLMHRQQRSGNSTVQSREDAKRGPQQ